MRIDSDSLTLCGERDWMEKFKRDSQTHTLAYKIEFENLYRVISFSKRSYAIIDQFGKTHLKCCGLQLTINKRCQMDLTNCVDNFIKKKEFSKLRKCTIPGQLEMNNCEGYRLIKNMPYGTIQS